MALSPLFNTCREKLCAVQQARLDRRLLLSAISGDTQACARALKKGADINSGSQESETPLHFALGCGQAETAVFLIQNGARLDAKRKNGFTPLEWGQIVANEYAPVGRKEKVLSALAAARHAIAEQQSMRHANMIKRLKASHTL